jgi:hypothetical protein
MPASVPCSSGSAEWRRAVRPSPGRSFQEGGPGLDQGLHRTGEGRQKRGGQESGRYLGAEEGVRSFARTRRKAGNRA